MGIAAYNRGSAFVTRQIDATMPTWDQILIRDLNEHPKGEAELFQATVIRPDSRGWWWLMHRPDRGWAGYGRPYGSLREIASHYSLQFVAFGRDEHSLVVVVEPNPPVDLSCHLFKETDRG